MFRLACLCLRLLRRRDRAKSWFSLLSTLCCDDLSVMFVSPEAALTALKCECLTWSSDDLFVMSASPEAALKRECLPGRSETALKCECVTRSSEAEPCRAGPSGASPIWPETPPGSVATECAAEILPELTKSSLLLCGVGCARWPTELPPVSWGVSPLMPIVQGLLATKRPFPGPGQQGLLAQGLLEV